MPASYSIPKVCLGYTTPQLIAHSACLFPPPPGESVPSSGSGTSPLSGRVFVVVGAGGAGRALAFGAQQRGASVIVANRSVGEVKHVPPLL